MNEGASARARWATPAGSLTSVLVGMVVAVAVVTRFHGDLVSDLDHRLIAGPFHPGHVWCVEHVGQMVRGELPFGILTDRAGFPSQVAARCLVAAPAAMVAPLRSWFTAYGVYNLLVLGSPALAVLFAWLLARRVTALSSLGAAAASVCFAVSPYVLGCYAGGQTCKAQVWTLAACLWALTGALRGPWRPAYVLACGVFGLLTAATEPTYALVVPLVAGPWALVASLDAFRAPRRWRELGLHVLGGAAGLAALAAGLWTAKLYYDASGTRPAPEELFEPASRMIASGIHFPSAMAQPRQLFEGPQDLQLDAGAPNHVPYLGIPLMGALLLGTLAPWRGRALAWTAVVVGVVLSLGEWLVHDNAWVLTDTGARYALPARWLAKQGYPLARSVMYYRAAAVASLGVCLGAFGALGVLDAVVTGSVLRRRLLHALGAALALLLAGVSLWDTHRVLRPVWPVASRVVNLSLVERMAADPVPGAVLQTPLVHDARTGGAMLFDGVSSGRAGTGVLRHVNADHPDVVRLRGWLAEAAALPPDEAADALHAHGIRYIVAYPGQQQDPERLALYRTLGIPNVVGGRSYWRVGPEAP